MRVGIIAILQESNTFLDRLTSLGRFRENLLVTGNEVHGALADAHHEVGGFFQGFDAAGIEAVGTSPHIADRTLSVARDAIVPGIYTEFHGTASAIPRALMPT